MLKLFKKYKLSRYNVLVEDNGIHLLYNQVSGVVINLNDRLEDLQKIGDATLCFGSFKKKLRKHNFLVPVDQDELETFKKYFHRYLANNKDKRMVIAVTGRCNSGCFYCYQKDDCIQPFVVDMSEDVQKQLIVFVDRCISSTPTDRLTITWYGGEPLLRPDILFNLATQIRDICKKHNVILSHNIITNGLTLDDNLIDKLLEIDCRTVQVTIDGTREIHNIRRPRIDCEDASSYDIIMKNLITGYAKGLHITVRSNLDYSNAKSYKSFLQEILEKGLNKRNAAGGVVCPAPAMTRLPHGLAMTQEDFAKINNISIEMLTEQTETYRYLGRIMPGCMKHMPYFYNIAPNGNITKCIAHLFDDDFIGTIYDLELAEKDPAVQSSPLEDSECFNCPVLPSCGGGCVDRHKKYSTEQAGHYGGCQPIRWNLDRAVIGLYRHLQHWGEFGGHKE